MPARFVVEKVELHFESEGPEYYTRGEYQVRDNTTGEVVAAFPWSLDEPYLTNASYSGPDTVKISDDGTEAIAITPGQPEERVLLPTRRAPIQFEGRSVGPDTDMAALVREFNGQTLRDLFTRLGRTPMADALGAEIPKLLDDPDPRLRETALKFYYFLPAAPGNDRVLEIAETRRDLFRGRLDDVFIEALKMRLHHASSERTQALAQREGITIS
jgi:hypothetical protein